MISFPGGLDGSLVPRESLILEFYLHFVIESEQAVYLGEVIHDLLVENVCKLSCGLVLLFDLSKWQIHQ